MMNIFLNAAPLWGIEFMDVTWITVAIILMVVGEIAIGVFVAITDESLDCAFFISLIWIFVCIFWLPVLLIIVGIVAVAIP